MTSESRDPAERLLEGLRRIPALLTDSQAWSNERRVVFSLLKTGIAEAAEVGALEAPMFGNRLIEETMLFLIAMGQHHPNRIAQVRSCMKRLGASYNWSMAIRGSRRVRSAIQHFPAVARQQVLGDADALEVVALLDRPEAMALAAAAVRSPALSVDGAGAQVAENQAGSKPGLMRGLSDHGTHLMSASFEAFSGPEEHSATSSTHPLPRQPSPRPAADSRTEEASGKSSPAPPPAPPVAELITYEGIKIEGLTSAPEVSRSRVTSKSRRSSSAGADQRSQDPESRSSPSVEAQLKSVLEGWGIKSNISAALGSRVSASKSQPDRGPGTLGPYRPGTSELTPAELQQLGRQKSVSELGSGVSSRLSGGSQRSSERSPGSRASKPAGPSFLETMKMKLMPHRYKSAEPAPPAVSSGTSRASAPASGPPISKRPPRAPRPKAAASAGGSANGTPVAQVSPVPTNGTVQAADAEAHSAALAALAISEESTLTLCEAELPAATSQLSEAAPSAQTATVPADTLQPPEAAAVAAAQAEPLSSLPAAGGEGLPPSPATEADITVRWDSNGAPSATSATAACPESAGPPEVSAAERERRHLLANGLVDVERSATASPA